MEDEEEEATQPSEEDVVIGRDEEAATSGYAVRGRDERERQKGEVARRPIFYGRFSEDR